MPDPDRAAAPLAEALRAYVEWCGGVHDDECPCDDTCDCSLKWINDGVNQAVDYLAALAVRLRAVQDRILSLATFSQRVYASMQDGVGRTILTVDVESVLAILRESHSERPRPEDRQSCHCPARTGEDCPLTIAQCVARTQPDYGFKHELFQLLHAANHHEALGAVHVLIEKMEFAEVRLRAVQLEETSDEHTRVGPSVPRGAPIGSTAEDHMGNATAAERPEICICAAIQMFDGRIIRGHRHDDCMQAAAKMNLEPVNAIQGFVTSRNRFVTRMEAMQIQRAANIESVAGYRGGILFSEDLY